MVLCAHILITDITVIVSRLEFHWHDWQGRNQEFTKGGQTVWETEVSSRVQGQNMETLENTNWAVTKIDVRWRGGACTHVPPSGYARRLYSHWCHWWHQKTVLTCQFFHYYRHCSITSHLLYWLPYHLSRFQRLDRESDHFIRSCASLPTHPSHSTEQ